MLRSVSRSGTSIRVRSPSNIFCIAAAPCYTASLPAARDASTRKLACPGPPSPAPQEAQDMAGRGAVIVDVREADEWVQGHIPDALFIPRGFLELRVEEKLPDKSREIVLQCAGGT